jgi:hypothetical protein
MSDIKRIHELEDKLLEAERRILELKVSAWTSKRCRSMRLIRVGQAYCVRACQRQAEHAFRNGSLTLRDLVGKLAGWTRRWCPSD